MGLVAYIESSWCLIRTKHLMLTAASGHCYTMRRRRDHNFVPGGSQLLVVYLRQRDWTHTIGRLLCESHQTNEAISVASQLNLTKLKKRIATCYKDYTQPRVTAANFRMVCFQQYLQSQPKHISVNLQPTS